jgi:hypothetical protein
MKIRTSLAALALALAALALAAPAAAQQETAPVVKAKPAKPPKVKTEKFKGTVVHATAAQITVQGEENQRVVRTFSLSPKMRERMQKIIERGGYQHGDKVTVYYQPTDEVATRVRGKASKPR